MNKKIATTIPIFLSLVACQTMPDNPKSLRDCPAGSAQQDTVTLTAPMAAINAAPPHICVAPGTDIKVRIGGPPERGKVATQPKEGGAIWLNGSNAVDAGEFVLHVPSDAAIDDYAYNVFWKDKPKLDPMVSVRTEGRD